jgi:perosamine synthetase
MKIPLSSPDIGRTEIAAVLRVLRSGRLSLGDRLQEFESIFASYVGVSNAVAVSSGTAGLHLAVRALGLKEGDEVIVPSFAFIAVANALRYERVVPVFADINSQTLNLDPSSIGQAITSRTRAILVVHTFGVPAAMDEILRIAKRQGLAVIEDACEALGAEWNGKKMGSFGDVSVFGFYPNKQITTAEGGMVVTHNRDMAERIRSLRNHGRSGTAHSFEHSEPGYNYRLSELHCALGIAQMKRVESILKAREKVARAYHQRLEDLTDLRLPLQEIPGGRISWFVYVVRLVASITIADCDALVRRLASAGVQTGRYFMPIHLQPAYRDVRVTRVPLRVTESLAGRTLALPFFTRMTRTQVNAVCRAVQQSLTPISSKPT